MKNKLVITSIVLFASLSKLNAQKANYLFNQLEYNPAHTGSQNNFNANLLGGYQWFGFEGSPRFVGLSVQSPINDKTGVGLNVKEASIGPTKNRSIYGNLAYGFKVGSKSKLSFGLSTGVDLYAVDFSSLILVNPPPRIERQILPNLSLGTYWHNDKSYFGLSVDRLIENEYNAVIGKQKRSFFLIGGHEFAVNQDIKLKPSFLVEVTEDAPLFVRGDVNFVFYDKLQLGGGYSIGRESITSNVMYGINTKFKFGYAYEYMISSLGNYNTGYHQIVIGYNVNLRNKTNVFKVR